VSGLAHYLEDEGIATTIVSLVKVHSEKTRPPRSLWVPYDLGRPLGAPSEPDEQRRILTSALSLLERTDGPCLLEDFANPQEDLADDTWVCPAPLPDPADIEAGQMVQALKSELAIIKPLYDKARQETGRTTVGLATLGVMDLPDFIEVMMRGEIPPGSRSGSQGGFALGFELRFAVDDLKAMYFEAAAWGPGSPSAEQLTNWFWRMSVAARLLWALSGVLRRCEDPALKFIGGNFLIPAEQVGIMKTL
jgi:hypothetical protein